MPPGTVKRDPRMHEEFLSFSTRKNVKHNRQVLPRIDKLNVSAKVELRLLPSLLTFTPQPTPYWFIFAINLHTACFSARLNQAVTLVSITRYLDCNT